MSFDRNGAARHGAARGDSRAGSTAGLVWLPWKMAQTEDAGLLDRLTGAELDVRPHGLEPAVLLNDGHVVADALVMGEKRGFRLLWHGVCPLTPMDEGALALFGGRSAELFAERFSEGDLRLPRRAWFSPEEGLKVLRWVPCGEQGFTFVGLPDRLEELFEGFMASGAEVQSDEGWHRIKLEGWTFDPGWTEGRPCTPAELGLAHRVAHSVPTKRGPLPLLGRVHAGQRLFVAGEEVGRVLAARGRYAVALVDRTHAHTGVVFDCGAQAVTAPFVVPGTPIVLNPGSDPATGRV